MKTFSILAKTPEKQKSNLFRSALLQMKTRVCLKYFVHDCRHSMLRALAKIQKTHPSNKGIKKEIKKSM